MIYVYITNPKTNLRKIIDMTEYTVFDFKKTVECYYNAGYEVTFKRSL